MWFGFQMQNLLSTQKSKKLLKYLPLITLGGQGEAKGSVHLPGPYYMPEAQRPSLSSGARWGAGPFW